MKRAISLTIGILLVLSGCITLFAAEERVVRVGAFNYYPGIFKDTDGVIKGFYVDALADIAHRENLRFEYIYGSWSEGLERIKTGEVDVLTSVAFTPERAGFLDYAKTPLLTVWGELYVPLESDIDGIREVQGKRVAVMKGDFNGRHFIDLVKKFGISCEFVEMPGFDDVFQAVSLKKVDAGVVNSTFGVAKQNEYGLRSTGVVFNPFDIFFAVAKGKHQDLLEMLDRYLGDWRHQAESPYNRARQKWSHGRADVQHVIPWWVTYSVVALGVLIVLASAFIVLLRQQVTAKTTHLQLELELKKQREEELERQNAELERFTYTVSHDLKSPLVTIMSFAGSIRCDLESGRKDRFDRDLMRIENAAGKMAHLLNDVLKLSRIGRIINTPEQSDMGEMVQEVLSSLAGALDERRVKVSVQPDLPSLLCDRQRMEEVLQNLVENAIKSMGDQAEPHILIGIRETPTGSIFFVQDNGIGIPKEYHQNIFGLFNKLDAASEGTGIGLALVKRIVEVHGGRVWVESAGSGMGSRFCFTLPGDIDSHVLTP